MVVGTAMVRVAIMIIVGLLFSISFLVGYCGIVVVVVVVTVFVRVAFVIVVGELLLSICCVMVAGGVVVGVMVIVGYLGDGGKVEVLMVMMSNIRLAVMIRKNSFIYMLNGIICGVGSGGGVNSGYGSSCLAHHQNHHSHYHHTVYTNL